MTDPSFHQGLADAVLALPAAAAMGFAFTVLAGGRAETRMPWRPEHSHAPGAFQAGPIAALVDFTGAAAAVTLLPAGGHATSVDLTTKYLAEARGDVLVARARVLRAGRASTVVAVDVTVDDHDELCATALVGVKNRRPTDPAATGT